MGFIKKLAGQTAIYGISSIVVRFLSYLLYPYYTREFGQAPYGIVTDVYSLVPFALVVLTLGMESSYFRFAAKTDEQGKRHLFATTWGITSMAAVIFCVLVMLFNAPLSAAMGSAYVEHPTYLMLVAFIIMFDVFSTIPFSRLREQGRAKTFVALKIVNITVNVLLAFTFGAIGLFKTDFGVGWVFVANLIPSVLTLLLILTTTDRVVPRVDWQQLRVIFAYSIPLLIGGVAGTANEFIDRQFIKNLVPAAESFSQLGLYGAVTKLAVVMVLFTQMYRLAAEPFFLSNFRKEDFLATNAAALKYYVLVSMFIFLGIALFRNVFALLAGPAFREGVFILPVILGANVLSGVWLNLSFWYKREEKTRFAIYVTFVGLIFTIAGNMILIPHMGYYGAAWARLLSEASMVAVSIYLNRKFFPTPYQWGRILEFVAVGLALYFASTIVSDLTQSLWIQYSVSTLLCAVYVVYAGLREGIFKQVAATIKLKRN